MPKTIAQDSSSARGAAVRARLLAAAVELIPEHGWGAVSTRMLAERAGVAPGLVHYHFDSVQHLLRTAAVGTIRELLDASTAQLDGVTAREAVVAVIESIDAFPGHDPTSLLISEAYLAATRDPDLRTQLAHEVMRFRGAMAELIAAGGHTDSEPIAAVVAALLDGLMLHRALGVSTPSRSAARLALRLLDGGTR